MAQAGQAFPAHSPSASGLTSPLAPGSLLPHSTASLCAFSLQTCCPVSSATTAHCSSLLSDPGCQGYCGLPSWEAHSICRQLFCKEEVNFGCVSAGVERAPSPRRVAVCHL